MPNVVRLELFYDGAWHDLVADDRVLSGAPIVIHRGDGAESSAPRPASLTARLDNTSDVFRTSNPESPLYGVAGRNTPARVAVGGVYRAAVETTAWTCGQTRDFRASPKRGSAWTDIEGGGLLQRINGWTEPLRSAFREWHTGLTTIAGYWPCEENRDARSLTALTPGSSSVSLRGYSFDNTSYPAGSGPVLELARSTGALASGRFGPSGGTAAAGWQVSWVALHQSIPSAGNYSTILRITTDDGDDFLINRGDASQLQIQVTPPDSFAYRLNVAATLSPIASFRWACYVVRASESAGTITVRVFRCLDNETAFTEVVSGTYAGTLGRLSRWFTSTGLDESPIGFGHLIGVYGQTEDLTASGRVTAFLGHAGERTAYRFARLCDLKGIPYFLRGDPNRSTPCGPQTVQTLEAQFRELRDTEDGLIFDEKGGLYVIFTLADARYNVPAVTLDVTDLPAPPPEVTDDLEVSNLITVSNSSGGEVTAEDTTGPLGTAAPPDGAGEQRRDVKVNIDDVGQLEQHANWWLRRGTVDLPRYPRVTVNLATLSPAQLSDVEDIDIGEVLEITGWREGTIRLRVIGYTETIGWPNARTIVFTCAPDQPFHVRTYDDARYDLRTCTVKTSATSTATTLTLQITDDEAWSSTSAYDLLIAGEQVGVPIGGMAARTGSPGAYEQVLTGAVRSKNGVVKAQTAGNPVRVVTQGRYAR